MKICSQNAAQSWPNVYRPKRIDANIYLLVSSLGTIILHFLKGDNMGELTDSHLCKIQPMFSLDCPKKLVTALLPPSTDHKRSKQR